MRRAAARSEHNRRALLHFIAPAAGAPDSHGDTAASPWNDLSPLRDTLFSTERLEEHARDLAREHVVAPRPPHRPALARRITENAEALADAYRRLSAAADARETIPPSAEWIIDNYHIIERQIREIRIDLPPGYYKRLPKLASGPLCGYPRILGATWAYVTHTDSHFSPDVLCRFFCAYQQVTPLMIGELWAVPITLRILLVENLRRFAELTVRAREARAGADALADALLAEAALGADALKRRLADLSEFELSDAFAVHLAQRLRDQDPHVAPALTWLDQRLEFEHTTVDDIVQAEQQREINATVTVRNIISSMRLANDVDWRELFERMSLVDGLLAKSTAFADMDFPTRDLYRRAIEDIARSSNRSELDIAGNAIAAAAHAPTAEAHDDPRISDPGHYLIGAGRTWFENAVGYRPPLRSWPARTARALGIAGYVAAGVSTSLLLLALGLWLLTPFNLDWRWLALLAFVGAVPAADAAVALVNNVLTHGLSATVLPGMDLQDTVPEHLRTIVVAPTLLTTPEAVAEQIERLEVHYLSSPKGEIYFALLSDWTDAATPHADTDEALLSAAASGIARLNDKYGPASDGARFLLLHRKRVWTESEGKWIGWERKRGKLGELNELLRGGGSTTFVPVDGAPPRTPRDVRYVVTLDADTRLTAEALRRLIGKMAHPLNMPRFDPDKRRVIEGYAILQPRVTPSMPIGREATPFLRIFSNMSGIDPYAAAASDVYQDLLGEGSYTGKGIYDVDAFRAALSDRAPASSLLSHDLFEGVFARSALASDIEFVEDFPARYDSAALRHHRWARGDWQLLPWILGLARDQRGRRTAVPAVGRWKMIDNLRRTLSAPAAMLALLAGVALPSPADLVWIGFILAMLAATPLLPVAALAIPRWGRAARRDLRAVGASVRLALAQWLLSIALLAHQGLLMADAVLRTLWRLVARRNLLEWTPAAQARVSSQPTLDSYYSYMYGAVLIGVGALFVSWLARGEITWPAIVLAVAWSSSPAIAAWTSRVRPGRQARRLSADDVHSLRLIARRTWRYFETFVTPEHNWLPPDNFQEDPSEVVAHRTSPTNIGLYLLSAVAAHDLGWASLGETTTRLEATLRTLQKLDRYRGHFYNWYDTHDLRALDPRYVSSVDSGNLAGHLLVVANACEEWIERGGGACADFDLDALAIARLEAARLRASRRMPTLSWVQIEREIAALETAAQALTRVESPPIDDLAELARRAEELADTIEAHTFDQNDQPSRDLIFWLRASSKSFASLPPQAGAETMETIRSRLAQLADAFRAMAFAMDFTFLLDRHRLLLSIGYRGADGVLDPSCYDLLASEARLASFFAIAKGDAPTKHWFRLSHAVTLLPHGPALISWSGSMFEYLMPTLVMQEPTHSLLERTNQLIVQRQIDHGRQLKTPWGVSESAYNARDLEFNYQYSNFGVPGLGLKRGLADNAVISPYATALAAMVQPLAAVHNFNALAETGALGRFGFYEAIDFTAERLQSGKRAAIIRSFMAHHQGMTVSAIANVLCGGVLRARFHAEPTIKAAELLLQERMPLDIQEPPASVSTRAAVPRLAGIGPAPAPRSPSPWSASPASHLLSNGQYTVMLTSAGGGSTTWRGLALTRWREDPTCDDWGAFLYVRDLERNTFWSPTLQPTCRRAHRHHVSFDEGKAEFTSERDGLTTTLEIIVSEEDDADVRRLSIHNSGVSWRELEVTSFAELALAAPAADAAHPAFSKLFVELEHLPRTGALLARRRLRGPDEQEFWAAHLAVAEGETVGQREFETDRGKFFGRCRDAREPLAVASGAPLSNTTGASLDPIFALRRRVRIGPGETARIHFWTMAASSRQEAIELIDKHNDTAAFARAETLAWTQAQIELHHIGIDRATAGLYQRLASHLIYANPAMRPGSEQISAGRSDQSQLWSMGVSGDLPIMLVRISEAQEIAIVKEALQALEYFRTKRLAVDLVIMNERAASYQQDLQNAVENAVRASQQRPHIGSEAIVGHIYVLRADLVPAPARQALTAAARVILRGDRGNLADQLRRRPDAAHIGREPQDKSRIASVLHAPGPAPDLKYFNGLGGFSPNDGEYMIALSPGQTTPAPWVNVVANDRFGFHVSETGAGSVWSENSRERQITPWSNDPVRDPPGQAFYVRDRDTGELFTPTAAPLHDENAACTVRHGRGYSRFEHVAHGLELSLLEFAPRADPVKISRLTLVNTSPQTRRLSVTAYVEWVLGASRAGAAPHIVTERDASGAVFATNRWNAVYAERVAFMDMLGRQQSWTGDRHEFVGRNGTLAAPAALGGGGALSGRLGAGLDPCGAMQTMLELAPGARAEIVVLLGDAADAESARALIETYRTADLDAVFDDVRAFWNETLGVVQVETPDRSFDLMMNGWLLYQTLACRLWARAGFYQASGAYGYRDQLQDTMAVVLAKPELMRQHLLRAAAQQFVEGDVQHWWLPQTGQGVRTRISDDRIWLPVAASYYVARTGDAAILDESAPFIEGPPLETGEAEAFYRPQTSDSAGSLYEHCARALDASLATGPHGLPLIGGGDWNDGLNRMGLEGRGESVWLGWFLCTALRDFAPFAEARGDTARVERWRRHIETLRASLERDGWDGEWYRRAWHDDGAVVGSAASVECRIDSIAQSWAVLSGAADPERARTAMAAVERDLIREQDGMALLFSPPFDKAPLDPGYIRGYPPGIRENGGQYTHGAVWSVMALAELGEGDKAAALFWMLNPINHARTRTDAHRYRVEPYVMAADVYSAPGQVGRGGWTWYTGSAGLMYRAGLEYILGLRVEADHLHVSPCLPKGWPGFSVRLLRGATAFEIDVRNPDSVSTGVKRIVLDGAEQPCPRIPLARDGACHSIEITLG